MPAAFFCASSKLSTSSKFTVGSNLAQAVNRVLVAIVGPLLPKG